MVRSNSLTIRVVAYIVFALNLALPIGADAQVELAKEAYFPDGVFGMDTRSSDGIAELYSSRLRAMREKPLMLALHKQTIFRAFRMDPFATDLVARLTINQDGTGFLIFKQFPDSDGLRKVSEHTRLITKEAVDQLMKTIDQADFWHSPSAIVIADPDARHCVLEGVEHDRYHVIARQELRPTPLSNVCVKLIDMGR